MATDQGAPVGDRRTGWSKREPFVVAAAVWLTIAFAVLPIASTMADEVGACDLSVLELEVAGTQERFEERLRRCPGGEEDPSKADVSGIRRGLFWDSWLLVPTYVTLLAIPAVTAHCYARPRGRTGQGFLRLGACAAVVAGALDVTENLALRKALDDPDSSTWPVVAFAAAVPKFALLAFAGLAALYGLRRVWLGFRHPPADRDLTYFRPTGAGATDRAFDVPERPPAGALGIACSGGGIRSAAFCMGAVQAFDDTAWSRTDESIVRSAECMTSVSGGGYFAGARQLLLWQGVERPFRAGSHEEDYVRRHGRYLADRAGEWLAAVARLVAGLVLNVGLIVLLLFLLARPLGWAQDQLVPCQPVSQEEAEAVGTRDCVPGEYDVGPQHWAAAGLPAALALALVVVFVIRRERSDTGTPFSSGDLVLRGAAAAAIGAIGAAAVTLLTPGVSYGLRWLLPVASSVPLAEPGGVAAAGGTVLAMLGTGLKALAGRRSQLQKAIRGTGADDASPPWVTPIQLLRRLAGVALAVCGLLLLAAFVEGGLSGPRADAVLALTELELWLVLSAVAAVVFLATDQTTWSLHSLYRRRLSTAFVLEPRCSDEPVASGEPRTIIGFRERAYTRPTTLSEAAERVPGEPRLVVCAAANLRGADVAPPGRQAVTFTFEDRWVGSPQLGYVGTADYERSLSPSLRGDTTLLAAMAISGAAVASAMGRHSKGALQSVLALFNVRLGVWLPTPTFADEVNQGRARTPRTRRFSYLFREILGLYDSAEALTYVSDGGHYENLGVVELLRRRCSYVLCLDASGGPSTLVEALRLAETELGVRVDVDRANLESVRTQPAREGDDGPLPGRLAAEDVLVARIHYPAVAGIHLGPDGSAGLPAATGWLVYGRAVLTRQSPAGVLDHAAGNVRFPNDPTGDQWFDADQFDNYLLLGRHVGERMAAALENVTPGKRARTRVAARAGDGAARR